MTHRQTEQGSTKRTVIIIIGAVVVLAIVGLLVWMLVFKGTTTSITKNSTGSSENAVNRDELSADTYDGWKTFSSTRDSYSIQYPSNWILIPETDTDGVYIRNKQPVATYQTDGYPKDYINFRVFRSTDDDYSIFGMTAKGYFEALGTTEVTNGASNYAPEDVTAFTLNGQPAKKVKSVFTETTEDILVLNGNILYTVSIYPYGGLTNETARQILASFKVTS